MCIRDRVIIDVHLNDSAGFSSHDIDLKIGSGNNLSDFERLDVAADISVRPGEGADGSDRISIVLPNGSVVNEYLQVTLFANQTTGLDSNDVFYFGNVIAEIGDSENDSFVSANDVGAVRSNLSGFFAEDIDSPHDINRDRFVDATDVGIARNNLSGFFPVPLITCLLYTSPSPRDLSTSRMPSSA